MNYEIFAGLVPLPPPGAEIQPAVPRRELWNQRSVRGPIAWPTLSSDDALRSYEELSAGAARVLSPLTDLFIPPKPKLPLSVARKGIGSGEAVAA